MTYRDTLNDLPGHAMTYRELDNLPGHLITYWDSW